jgi:hypothetical protein
VAEQAGTHWFPAQTGVAPEHCALDVQPVPGFGSQAPFWQVYPVAHCIVEQAGTQRLSAQTSPDAHWFVKVHAFGAAVQVPPAQTWSIAHCVFAVHGQGPSVPPHVGPASTPPEEEPLDEEPEDDPDEPEEEPEEAPDEEPDEPDEPAPDEEPTTPLELPPPLELAPPLDPGTGEHEYPSHE